MLSKSISTSKKVTQLHKITGGDFFPILLYTWLHPHVDDFGRYDADEFTIKHSILPTLEVSETGVKQAINNMERVGLIRTWEVNNKKVLEIVAFEEHQTGLTEPRVNILMNLGVQIRDKKLKSVLIIYNKLFYVIISYNKLFTNLTKLNLTKLKINIGCAKWKN